MYHFSTAAILIVVIYKYFFITYGNIDSIACYRSTCSTRVWPYLVPQYNFFLFMLPRYCMTLGPWILSAHGTTGALGQRNIEYHTRVRTRVRTVRTRVPVWNSGIDLEFGLEEWVLALPLAPVSATRLQTVHVYVLEYYTCTPMDMRTRVPVCTQSRYKFTNASSGLMVSSYTVYHYRFIGSWAWGCKHSASAKSSSKNNNKATTTKCGLSSFNF